MDKLRPDDKETNDLFLDKLPPIIQAVVNYNTSALDVDSHNDMELLENEDVMMTEDITRTTAPSTSSSSYNNHHQNSIVMMTSSSVSMSEATQSSSVTMNHHDVDEEGPAPISIEKRRQMMSVGKFLRKTASLTLEL